MTDQREIIKILHDYKQEHAKQYGILAIGIFGSVARGEAVLASLGIRIGKRATLQAWTEVTFQ